MSRTLLCFTINNKTMQTLRVPRTLVMHIVRADRLFSVFLRAFERDESRKSRPTEPSDVTTHRPVCSDGAFFYTRFVVGASHIARVRTFRVGNV